MPYKARLSALVAKGYFPAELPPVFTTRDFGTHVSDVIDEWRKAGVFKTKHAGKVPAVGKPKRDAYTYALDAADSEIISKPKRGYERRNIAITHPVPQALLSYELAKNWKTIQKWLSHQAFSLDKIRISDRYARSLQEINFEIHSTKKAYVEASSDWLVKTDISRFYPTIYTHSIAWAAYGKHRVKENIGCYKGSLADRLDILVRSCNRNQTVGIPIGPETSRIIAEIISSRIDSNFQKREPDIPKECVDRRQDDWIVGCDTLHKAEAVLAAITSIYREFGLEINGVKTSINHIIGESGTVWISEIGAFLSHRGGPIRAARLRELLTLSLRLQSEFPNESVINYVLSIIETQHVEPGDAEALESFLLKAAVLSPISMNRICGILLNLQFKTQQVSRRRIGTRFMDLATRHLQNGNLYEAIWLVYTLRGLKIPLYSSKMSDAIKSVSSSALALIVLEMKSKGLCMFKLPEDNWSRQITKDTVRSDWTWLLGYEGIRQGWLPDSTNVMGKPLFRALASRNVMFYDSRRNMPQSAKVVRLRNQYRRRQRFAMKKMIESLRGLRADEY